MQKVFHISHFFKKSFIIIKKEARVCEDKKDNKGPRVLTLASCIPPATPQLSGCDSQNTSNQKLEIYMYVFVCAAIYLYFRILFVFSLNNYFDICVDFLSLTIVLQQMYIPPWNVFSGF